MPGFSHFRRFVPLLLLLELLLIASDPIAAGSHASRRLRSNEEKCPCNEIYVVEEGETLESIARNCAAPYILEDNPQMRDGSDLFQGLVLMVQCEDPQVSR